jgi:hypothetical protein
MVGTVNLMDGARVKTVRRIRRADSYTCAATPVTSAQLWNACALMARY